MTHPASFIDWELARATAARVSPPGPAVSQRQAQQAVAELREAALRAQEPVAETTRLRAPDGPAALVVDRPTWVDINTHSFAALMDPVVGQILDRKKGPQMPAPMRKVGGALSGVEVGGVLAFLSTRVLGQYDHAPGRPADQARLLLVAPNVVETEQAMKVDPTDFRLWVCLHEETHRVQFTANPWLREHMVDTARSLLADIAPDPDSLRDRVGQLVRTMPDAMREGGGGLVTVVTTPEQRRRLDEVTAVMSLLEGHADVVMDEVGPQVIPSVASIRRRFETRRDGLGPVDIILRRLLGLEAKIEQYRKGAVFVRGVVDRVGMDDFNAVWTSPETLPTPEDIEDPQRWIARVHG
ncbi:MAG: zinc-dependent metalloprotease [Mobilicoccus sp.]|nr:zinc-dependent metalloprotease [Mobilicoccus sp.]